MSELAPGRDWWLAKGNRVRVTRGKFLDHEGTITGRSRRPNGWVDVRLDGWTVSTRWARASLVLA